ncbi:MAG: hypothetical protein RL701_4785, partial [Pseudomonadota bacterium]
GQAAAGATTGGAGSDSDEPAQGGTGGGSEPKSQAVTIRFKPVVGDADFACGKTYSGLGSANTTVTPQDFRMFVQDVALIKADGTKVPVQLDKRAPWQLATVALLDFENQTGNCVEGSSETNDTITGTVPSGEYTGLSFRNGVPEELNHADPTTFEDPLKKYAALSWGWLGGFRYVKAELAQQVPAGQEFGVGFAHPGATSCTKQDTKYSCRKANRNLVELTDFDVSSDVVLADIAAIFENTDLTQPAECHSSGEFCAPMFDALGINFATGEPKAGQTVFRTASR